MNELQRFDKTSLDCSKKITKNYSTSFSLGIRMIDKDFRWAIYAVYGLVRFADEIVDTFHHTDKKTLLDDFKFQTYKSIKDGISLNPVLHAFQLSANRYSIGEELIEPFFKSMEMDLNQHTYTQIGYEQYIYGSAEVVGLMCLKVFVDGNEDLYNELKPYAKSLGSAFQKVNFLRDMRSDLDDRGRVYFPDIDFSGFEEHIKSEIIADIQKDFDNAFIGIKKLPSSCKFGVYTAYIYYLKLLEKIESTPAANMLNRRIRIPNSQKMALLFRSYLKVKANTF
jgi:phytoene/squalene synthetase